MKDTQKKLLGIIALSLSIFLFAACSDTPNETEDDIPETEARHRHEYHLKETREGDCKVRGYQLYECDCGESFKSLLPSEHVYVDVKDTSGNCIKRVCNNCGDYSIIRDQKYTFYIDFEGMLTVEAAGTQAPYVEYYGRSGTSAEIETDAYGSYAKLVSSNYYLLDTSEIMKKGQNFVISFDVKFDRYAKGALFSLIPFNNGSFSYNDGLIRIDASGTLSFLGSGDSQYNKTVVLPDKGYSNIAIAGNMKTGLYDVYVNEELVRKDIPYIKSSSSLEKVYLRYLDKDTGSTAFIDDLKLYVAETPEFVIDESKLYFNP